MEWSRIKIIPQFFLLFRQEIDALCVKKPSCEMRCAALLVAASVAAGDPSIPDNYGLFAGTVPTWPSEYELAFYGTAATVAVLCFLHWRGESSTFF